MLGVVIGITSIVGMTALIRGFDQSLRDLIGAIGPNTIFVQRFGITELRERRRVPRSAEAAQPDHLRRARAREQATTLQYVDIELGAGVGPPTSSACFYRDLKTKPIVVFGTGGVLRRGHAHPDPRRPVLQRHRSAVPQERRRPRQHGRTSCCSSRAGIDPIGKTVRVGSERFEVVGVFDKRPTAGRLQPRPGRLRRHPVHDVSAHLRRSASVRIGSIAGRSRTIQISVLPREGVSASDAMADVERVMRIRHGLRLDEPNDFDLVTQDAFLKLWDRISQATFFALVVISSIALMVGGIGVMAIMSISVTERTREIGVRKALGARRAEILFQFLMEAAFLTSLGGLLGIALGSGIGWAVHLVSGLPDLAAVVVVRHRPRLLGRRSASSSACTRRSRPPASIRSKRCATNSAATVAGP